MAGLSRAHGISRKTAHQWIRRFLDGGLEGLAERTRARRGGRSERALDDRLQGAVPDRGRVMAVPADGDGRAQPLPARLRGARPGVGPGHAGDVARSVPGARLAGALAQRQRQPVRRGRGRSPEQAGRVVVEAGHRVGADPARPAAAERAARAHAPGAASRDGAAASNRRASTASATSTTECGRTKRWASDGLRSCSRARPGHTRTGCRTRSTRCTGSGGGCAGTAR